MVLWGVIFLIHPWPMFQRDAYHTGRGKAIGPTELSILWIKEFPSTILTSPVIDSIETIYVATKAGSLHAVDSTGKEKWSFNTGTLSSSTPVLWEDKIFWGSYDKNFYCLKIEDGKLIWKKSVGKEITSSLSLLGDKIYFGAKTTLYAINTEGDTLWTFDDKKEIGGAPAIDGGGRVYIHTFYGGLTQGLYSVSNGSQNWYVATGGGFSSPAIDDKGNIYVGTQLGEIYSLSSTGSIRWRKYIGTNIQSSPAIAQRDRILIGSDDGFLYAFDDKGNLLWKYNLLAPIQAPPVIDAQGTVYVGTMGGNIYAIDKEGKLKWKYSTQERITMAGAFGKRGNFYIPAKNRLYAFGPGLGVGVEEHEKTYQKDLVVQVSPNPFSHKLNIKLHCSPNNRVNVRVYSPTGEFITELFDGELNLNFLSLAWDGYTANGKKVPAGIYFILIQTPSNFISKKVSYLGEQK